MKKFLRLLTVIIGMGIIFGCENIANDVTDEAARVAATAYNVIRGTNYTDNLTGTSGADQIWGLKKGDYLYGYGGNDEIFGGEGNDYIRGGSGNDRIYDCYNGTHTDDGEDQVWAESGNDTIIITGEGNDFIAPGSGNDIVVIDKDNSQDTVKFEDGTDTVYLFVNEYRRTYNDPWLTAKYLGSQPASGTKKIIIPDPSSPYMTLSHEHFNSQNKTIFYVKRASDGYVFYTIVVEGYTSTTSTQWLTIEFVYYTPTIPGFN